MLQSYGIKRRRISTKNPQANGILERVHDTIKECLKSFQLQKKEFDLQDPWTGFLADVAYAIRSTHHTSLNASPAELVFGRNMLLPIKYIANWEQITNNNQTKINKTNILENRRRIDYDYRVGDQVYLEIDELQRKLNNPREGPYTITQVHVNGTVTIQKGSEPDRINIRRISPLSTGNMGGSVIV